MTEAIIVHFFQTAHKKYKKSTNECYVGQISLHGSNAVGIHSPHSDPFHNYDCLHCSQPQGKLSPILQVDTHNKTQDQSNVFPLEILGLHRPLNK